MREIGIYVHIPFCKSKCSYCDFNSFADKAQLVERYIKSLQKEIKRQTELVHTLYENFTIDKDVEFTIEVNPRNSGP